MLKSDDSSDLDNNPSAREVFSALLGGAIGGSAAAATMALTVYRLTPVHGMPSGLEWLHGLVVGAAAGFLPGICSRVMCRNRIGRYWLECFVALTAGAMSSVFCTNVIHAP
jgi:hypothetical protein